MQEAFRIGGFGMYPTTMAGLFLVATAVQYARHPDRARLALVRALAVLTALAGALGFTTGMIKSWIAAGGVEGPDAIRYALVGTGESLTNVALAMILLVMAAIATCVGTYRARPGAHAGGATLTDPHAK